MSLIVASLVKDEMDRFLPSALRAWSTFADEIVILDDNSGDGSDDFAEDFGAHVLRRRDAPAAWGAETDARRTLFEAAWSFARVGDYVLWLDADMVPARSPRVFMDSESDGVLFRLYDLWGKDDGGRLLYREDSFWQGHFVERLWMVKKRRDEEVPREWEWGQRGIHCGHLPLNFACDSFVMVPEDYYLLHFAYVAPELREEKYVRYASVAAELTTFERDHAKSILDAAPELIQLPFEPELSLI